MYSLFERFATLNNEKDVRTNNNRAQACPFNADV